jgi:small multidrug resistance family-3 protein
MHQCFDCQIKEDRKEITVVLVAKSLLYFFMAGLCEIGGGYLVWLWLREGKSIGLAIIGALVLVLYGIIPTLQPANFGRVYAAYGGVFIVLSILWGWQIDKIAPDRFDIIGGIVALAGVVVIMYVPRT